LSRKELSILNFEPITVLYGGNGSGKTTALNIISEKLKLKRDSRFNQSSFFPDYIRLCEYSLLREIPSNSRTITSEGIDTKREELFEDYLDAKYSSFKFNSMEDYEQLKKVNQARSKTQSKYVRTNLMENIREHSNGENAFLYFQEKIQENGLYLLDEPENSLSPERQIELVNFIQESVRFFGCQFIISTHSPFLLGMKDAKIYDLDQTPVKTKPWTELKNIKIYHDFFEAHRDEF